MSVKFNEEGQRMFPFDIQYNIREVSFITTGGGPEIGNEYQKSICLETFLFPPFKGTKKLMFPPPLPTWPKIKSLMWFVRKQIHTYAYVDLFIHH